MSHEVIEQSTQESTEQGYIRLENLDKTFGGGSIIAVKDVNLNISQDEFVVLLGPSGCGKTTTLRCIAGLEQPDSGQIIVKGENITDKKPKDRNLAFVFQEIALYPHKSVRENIRFGLDMTTNLSKQEKNEKVDEAAEILGISELLDRRPSELSGGQQQRVSLGRAMVMEPDAFLLDEPFSALDANLRDQMRVEIKKLQRRLHTSMIFVTHDQEEAMTLGDKIVVMNDAEIQQIGTPYEIYNEPNTQFAAEFIGSPSANMIQCQVENRGGGVDLVSELFTVSLPDETVEQIDRPLPEYVILGIRPEYLELDTPEPLFEAEISVIEPHGSQDAVHLMANGKELTAIVSQNAVEMTKEYVTVSFDTETIWLFDQEGNRLL